MNNFLSQLNLTAQERRIVVGIFLVFLVVINYLFVWPQFSAWGSLNKQLDKMRGDIERDNGVIKLDWDPAHPTNGWRTQVQELTKREGGSVMTHPVDPQVQLQNTIRTQERKTGIFVESINPGTVKTNEFFEEQSTLISLECQEPQLVSFLYNMGMDPAMIRVAMLNLKPADANRYRLKASLTLTANYTRKPPAAVNESAPDKRNGTRPIARAKPGEAPGPKRPGAPEGGPAGKRPPFGPVGPGGIRQQPGGQKPFMPGKPKNRLGQKVPE